MRTTTMLAALAALLIAAATAHAADSPQFRGPNRDGIFPEKGLLRQWPPDGPKLIWTVEGLGGGFSSPSIADGMVYVTGLDDKQDGWLLTFGLDGAPKWKKRYGAEGDGGGHPGTRSTATVDGDRLYLMSGLGRLVCMDAKTGDERWAVETLGKFSGKRIQWSLAESPLIDGDRVICTPGGPGASVVALNKLTGETVWTTKDWGEPSAYCSPIIFTVGGRRLLVTMTKTAVVGIDPGNGALLWSHEHITKYDIHATTPVFGDGLLYYTAGYRSGGGALELSPDGSKATLKWKDLTLDSQMEGVVLVDGYIYGTGHQTRSGLVCLELKTGKVMWKAADVKQGNIIFADGLLYVYSQNGDVSLIKPNPAAYELVSRFQVTQGTAEHWAHLAIANGRLYVRHGEAMMAYDIKAE